MKKINLHMISRVGTYLKRMGVPYKRIDETENILVMRSVNGHHYLLVQFFDMPDGWITDRRHFDIKVAQATDYKQVIDSINQYLNPKEDEKED